MISLDRAWPPSASQQLFRDRIELIHIQRPEAFLEERWNSAAFHPDRPLPGNDPAAERGPDVAFEATLQSREPLLSRANILLAAGEQHAHRVAEIIIEALESLSGGIGLGESLTQRDRERPDVPARTTRS